MKLVLYSGGQEPKNRFLHEALLGLTGSGRTKRMTYVPFCSDGAEVYFNRFRKRYRQFGATSFHCLPVDQAMQKADLRKALQSDVIYLAGGNTYYFLKHLQKNGLIPLLRKYAKEGGVLAGLSAGALILTPNIRLASIPKQNADRNEVAIKNLSGLGLVKFEFSPHYTGIAQAKRELLQYSRRTENPIYACRDGGGVVMDTGQERFEVFGKIDVFFRGGMHRLG